MRSQPVPFGPFTLDRATGTLLRGSEPVVLGHRAISLLQALLDARGQVVPKAALFHAAWPGIAVGEANLSVQIAALRKALGPAPGGREWIVTVPRIGYRLPPAELLPGDPLPVLTDLPRLAVMPFENLSDMDGQDYFAEGIVEDITTALGRFHSFAVVSHNSARIYRNQPADARQIALELGVSYLLQGSLRRSGDRLRISARLIEGLAGTQVWAGVFDGTDTEVFSFQDRITASVAAIIEPRLQAAELARSRRAGQVSVSAYDFYLRALPRWATNSAAGVREAVDLMQNAIALEPDNATYLSLLMNALQMRFGMGQAIMAPEQREQILSLAQRALEHGGDDALVLARCAITLVHIRTDDEGSIALARQAVAANPNSPAVVVMSAIVELHAGSPEAALALFQRLLDLSPGDPMRHAALCGLAHALLVLHRNDEALDAARQALATNPAYEVTYWMLIAANVRLGRMDEAQKYLALYLGHNPAASLSAVRHGQPAGQEDRIEPILQGLKRAGLPD